MKAMKQVSIAALVLAMTLGSVAAMPARAKDKPAKEAPIKPSEAIVKAAQVIQPALTKKDFATAKPAIEAVAPQVQNDDDKNIVGSWFVTIGQGMSDEASLSKGVDLMLASGKAPPESVKQLAFVQGQFAYQAKDYPKAQAAMEQAIAAGNTDENAIPILIESISHQGQRAKAIQTLIDAVAKRKAAGQPVPVSWYQRGYAMAYDIKQTDPAYATTRQAGIELSKSWVGAYPTADVWHDVILLYQISAPQDADTKVDIYRLQLAAKALRGGPDYLEYAESVYLRYPGEAKAVLDAGVSKGVLNMTGNRNATEINQIVTAKIPADKASLVASDKSSRAAANGRAAASTADAYLGYGEYAKAIDLYNVALGKGGVDANVINTRIGIALLRSGDAAGAKAAFAKVTGPRKDMADFWTILIDHPAA